MTPVKYFFISDKRSRGFEKRAQSTRDLKDLKSYLKLVSSLSLSFVFLETFIKQIWKCLFFSEEILLALLSIDFTCLPSSKQTIRFGKAFGWYTRHAVERIWTVNTVCFFFVLTKSILFSRHEPIAGVIFSSGMERVGVFNSHTTFVWLARVFVTEQSCSLGITVLISHAIGKNLRSWQKSSWDEAIYLGECHHLYDKPIILFGLFWCRCCFF